MPRNSTHFGIGLTETLRNTSGKLFKNFPSECGSNLQNPSDRICEIYEPDIGKAFVQCDQSGADARIMAYLMPKGNRLRTLYESNIKPHTYVATHLFRNYWKDTYRVDIDAICSMDITNLSSCKDWQTLAKAIPKDRDPITGFELKYFLGKKSVHSFNYKKQPQTFIFDILKETEGRVVLSKIESERIYNTYHELIPELRRLYIQQEHQLRTTRELRTLQGFPRRFEGLFTDKFFREAIAFIPSATVACINKDAWIDMAEYIDANKRDWDILNEKHDSLLCQAPIEEAEECGKILKGFQERDLIGPYGDKFRMVSECSIGYNWRKASESNPNGMKEIKI